MLTLKIKTNDYRKSLEFKVHYIHYQTDEQGAPIDICIVGTEETLLSICEEGRIGCAIEPINIMDYPCDAIIRAYYQGATHEALIARLPEFTVAGNCRVEIIERY